MNEMRPSCMCLYNNMRPLLPLRDTNYLEPTVTVSLTFDPPPPLSRPRGVTLPLDERK